MFHIQFKDTRGATLTLPRDTHSYHSRSLAEMVAKRMSNTNNPAWRGTFTVTEDEFTVLEAVAA